MNTTVKWIIHAHYLTIFSVVILTVFILGAHLYSIGSDWRILLALGGGAFSFLYFVQKQQLEEAHLIKDLITRFNGRYDELNDELNRIADETHKLTLRDQTTNRVLNDYFNLCGEEYLFYKRGFIYPEVWDSWVKGMRFFWKHTLVQEKWREETTDFQDFSQYYGFNPCKEFERLSEENLNQSTVLVHRYVEEVWNGHDASLVDEFFAPDYERHLSPRGEPLDREGQKRRIEGFLAAFPDIRFEVGDVFGEGGLVTFRATIHGTHHGEFAGVAPTGTRIEVSLIDVVRIEDGKFVEHWGGPDMLDLLRQIGAKVSSE